MNQSEAEDELTENVDDDAGLGLALDVGEVADLAGVEAGVGRLHVADADGGVAVAFLGGGHREAGLVGRRDQGLSRLVVVDLEADPASHTHTVYGYFQRIVLSSFGFI